MCTLVIMQFDSDFMSYGGPRTLNIDYKVVTPQTNNKFCKYVCHTRTSSDMGHLAVSFTPLKLSVEHNFSKKNFKV